MTEAVKPAAGAAVDRPAVPRCFVDAETDGVHPTRRPWEIAVIRREPDGRETEWAAFVEIDLSTADPFGLRVGRFYERHPLGRHIAGDDDLPQPYRELMIRPEYAAMDVAQMTHGAVVVGINPGFDVDVLDALLRAHGLAPAWDYTPICAKTHAAGWLKGRGLLEPTTPPWKTGEIAEKLGIVVPEQERHTALGDARLAMRMFDAVTGKGPESAVEPREGSPGPITPAQAVAGACDVLPGRESRSAGAPLATAEAVRGFGGGA